MSSAENELGSGQGLARGEELREQLQELMPPRTEEELLARPLRRGRFLVVDVETTGMKAEKARIIEIGAVEVDGFSVGRELGSLVYSPTPMSAFITALTGITTSMVAAAPRLTEVLPLVRRMLAGRILAAHNAHFDFFFLNAAWEQIWGESLQTPLLCTMKLARRTYPELSRCNLDAVASHLHLRVVNRGPRARHRALGDARLAAAALIHMCRQLEREGMSSVGELLRFQSARRIVRRHQLEFSRRS